MPAIAACCKSKLNQPPHWNSVAPKLLYTADRLVNLQYQKYPEYVLNNFQNLTLLSSIIYLFPKGQFHENLPIYFILLHRFSSHSAPLHYAPHQCDLALAPLLWLQVLANTESPSLRCKAAVDRLIENTALHEEWPHCTIVFSPPCNICHHAGLFGQTLCNSLDIFLQSRHRDTTLSWVIMRPQNQAVYHIGNLMYNSIHSTSGNPNINLNSKPDPNPTNPKTI